MKDKKGGERKRGKEKGEERKLNKRLK